MQEELGRLLEKTNQNDSAFEFLSLVSVAYEISIFTGIKKCPKIISSWSAKYFIEISNKVC